MFKQALKKRFIFKSRSSSPSKSDQPDSVESKSPPVQENELAQPPVLSNLASHVNSVSAASKSTTTSAEADADPESTRVDSIDEEHSRGIKILYNPSQATVDIVFIHGLTGNANSTWLHKKSNIHWPRDLIKEDIANARVMTFGYDVDVARFWGQVAQDGISGYAKDLLGKLARKRTSVVCG
jgi:hypothetical protein